MLELYKYNLVLLFNTINYLFITISYSTTVKLQLLDMSRYMITNNLMTRVSENSVKVKHKAILIVRVLQVQYFKNIDLSGYSIYRTDHVPLKRYDIITIPGCQNRFTGLGFPT